MINLILFGPPGAGKGTQSQKLIVKYQLTHISTGDLFRYNIKHQTDLGKLATRYMDAGNLVPDEVTNQMVKDFIERTPNHHGYIFDGYPRSTNQANYLDKLLKEFQFTPAFLISLEVDQEELIQRLLERGKISQRKDDQNEEVIRKRQTIYHQETAPVKEHYAQNNATYQIMGVGKIDEIFENISATLQSHL